MSLKLSQRKYKMRLKTNYNTLYKKYIIEKKSSKLIANELNTNRETVRRFLHFYKIPIKTPFKIKKEELYKKYIIEKKSTTTIANELNINRESIRKFLHFHKILIRSRSERSKGNKSNLGKKLSMETKMKIGLKNKNRKNPYLSEFNRKYRSELTKNLWKNPSFREIQIKKLINNNPMKNPEYRKKVSISKLGDKNPAKKPEVKEKIRIARMKQKFPIKDTKIEIILQTELKNRNILFVTHKPILNITQPDIFIEPNICIYCDGNFWHANPKFYDRNNLKSKIQINNLKNDEKVNKTLEENNYKIFRFYEDEIINNVSRCVSDVLCQNASNV